MLKEKGFTPILLLVGFLLIVAVAGGAYYFGKSQSVRPEAVSTPNPTITSQVIPSPSTAITSATSLATAWSGRLNLYSDSTLGISFQYPAFFIVNVIDTAKEKTEGYYYASLNKDYEYRTYGITFSVPQLTDAQITDAANSDPNFYSKYVDNIMYLTLSKYDNPRNLSLYDFLAIEYKVYAGNGIQATFDSFKQNLKSSAIPFPGSYEFVGNQGENPNRKVFFANKGKIYEFSLTGGLGTGQGYSADANNLLNNILQTVKSQ